MSWYNFGGNTERGRKGTHPSLAERIARAGSSTKPAEHLNTLKGQLEHCGYGPARVILEEAIEIAKRLSPKALSFERPQTAYEPPRMFY
jgi:hypothetical protein